MIFGISAVQITHLSQLPASSINQVTAEASWLTNAGVWLIIPGALLMLLGYVFGLVVYEKPLATNIQPPNTTSMSAPHPPTASGIAPRAQAPANQPSRGRAVQPAKKKENTP